MLIFDGHWRAVCDVCEHATVDLPDLEPAHLAADGWEVLTAADDGETTFTCPRCLHARAVAGGQQDLGL